MSRYGWTARHCIKQLGHLGIKLTVTDAGMLNVKAPDGIDLRPMLPVIKTYNRGIIRLLQESESPPHDEPNPAREAELMGLLPPALRATVGHIKKVMADLGDGAELIDIRWDNPVGVDALLGDLLKKKIGLRPRGGDIIARPRVAVTPELCSRIRNCKRELIPLFCLAEAEDAPQIDQANEVALRSVAPPCRRICQRDKKSGVHR